MENLYLAEEKGNRGGFPEVILDAQREYLSFEGDAYHEFGVEFFDTIVAWITGFLQTEGRKITMRYKMVYLNSSSSKRIFDTDITNL
jgi:hypothetical protein